MKSYFDPKNSSIAYTAGENLTLLEDTKEELEGMDYDDLKDYVKKLVEIINPINNNEEK